MRECGREFRSMGNIGTQTRLAVTVPDARRSQGRREGHTHGTVSPHGSEYIIRPEFILNFIALSPTILGTYLMTNPAQWRRYAAAMCSISRASGSSV